MNRFLLLLFCLICWECGAGENEPICNIPKQGYDLISIYGPEISANIEAKKAEPKFMAVAGYAIETPGAPGYGACWSESGLAKVIPGTSDTPCSQLLEVFQIAARLYAGQFNKQLVILRPELARHICAKNGSAS